MIGLLRELLATPEAHADAYTWAAVLLAHAALGAALTGIVAVIGISAWRAATVTSAAYLVLWEGTQAMLYGGPLPDGLVDSAAVAAGAFAAAAAWRHARPALATIMGAFAALLVVGVSRRRTPPADEGSPGVGAPIDTGNVEPSPPAAMLDRPRALQGEANRA